MEETTMLNSAKAILVAYILSILSISAHAQTTRVVVIPMGGDEPAKDKVIFITRSKYQGNLDGLSGADQKCQANANAQNSKVKNKAFKAWLGPTTDPLAGERQFNVFDLPYITPNGDVYAQSYSALLFLNPWPFLSIAADGEVISSSGKYDNIWTGRTYWGAQTTFNCSSWLSQAESDRGSAHVETHVSSSVYENPGHPIRPCSYYMRLACMEQ